MIILINHFLLEEPQLDYFNTRVEAEACIQSGLDTPFGHIRNWEAWEGKELEITPSGALVNGDERGGDAQMRDAEDAEREAQMTQRGAVASR